MCGYCIEHWIIRSLWRYGEFRRDADFEEELGALVSVYSFECPDFNQLLECTTENLYLDNVVIRIRLLCTELSRPLSDAECQLQHRLALPELEPLAQWPELSKVYQLLSRHHSLPYRSVAELPPALLDEARQLCRYTLVHFMTYQTANDELSFEEKNTQAEARCNEFYRLCIHIYLACHLLMRAEPTAPDLRNLAIGGLNFSPYPACDGLSLLRELLYHCVRHDGIAFFWQHLDKLTYEQQYYIACRCKFSAADLRKLEHSMTNEVGILASLKDCRELLQELFITLGHSSEH